MLNFDVMIKMRYYNFGKTSKISVFKHTLPPNAHDSPHTLTQQTDLILHIGVFKTAILLSTANLRTQYLNVNPSKIANAL